MSIQCVQNNCMNDLLIVTSILLFVGIMFLIYHILVCKTLGTNYGFLVTYIGTDKEKKEEVIKICVDEFKKMSNLTQKEFKENIVEKAKVSYTTNETSNISGNKLERVLE